MTYDMEFDEGVRALEEKNLATAYRIFTKLTEDNPDDYNAWLYRGIVLTEMGEYQDALDAFKRCMKIDDKAPHAYSNAGIAYQKLNDLPEAVRHFYKATKLDPSDINARLNLGMAYMKTRNKTLEAINELKYVIEHDDAIADAWYNLGLLFLDLQKKPFAMYCCEKAKALGLTEPKNNSLIRDMKFDGIKAKNPFDDDVKDTAFLPGNKDVVTQK
nr:tetratricopeptide repeat protein [Candidatus Sigynarchaeota archaeon]